MSTPATPSVPTPAGKNRELAPGEVNVGPSFEERLRIFWQNNSKIIAVALVIVLLAIAAKGGWEYMAAEKEREIGQAYAAATTPAQLTAFIAAHPDHSLAGIAQLRTGDDAYAAGKFSEAIAAYDRAIAILKTGPFASRARLGTAMAKLQGGNAAEGEAALKAIAANEKEIKAYRTEAAYHLASAAFAAGKFDDVQTYADQLSLIDPASPWTQRAIQLRATSSAKSPAPAGAVTLPGLAK